MIRGIVEYKQGGWRKGASTDRYYLKGLFDQPLGSKIQLGKGRRRPN